MVSGWLIDRDGEVVPDTSAQLRASYATRLSAEEFGKFAVTNLGFAHFGFGRRGIRVSWRPTTLTAQTFAGLALALGRQPLARVTVATLGSDWSYRLCATNEEAVGHLVEVFKTSTCDHEGHFAALRRRPDSLRQDDRLGRLMASSTRFGGTLNEIELWHLLDRFTDGRYVVVGTEHESNPLKVLAWGKRYRRFDEQSFATMAKDSFENQPDRAYARSVAAGYRQALMADELTVDDVVASNWSPGRGRCEVTYTRLLLPIRIAGTGLCLLSSCGDATMT